MSDACLRSFATCYLYAHYFNISSNTSITGNYNSNIIYCRSIKSPSVCFGWYFVRFSNDQVIIIRNPFDKPTGYFLKNIFPKTPLYLLIVLQCDYSCIYLFLSSPVICRNFRHSSGIGNKKPIRR